MYSLGNTTDRVVRPGATVAYCLPEVDVVVVLIADPRTGSLLGAESIEMTDLNPDMTEPIVNWMEVHFPPRWVADFQSIPLP